MRPIILFSLFTLFMLGCTNYISKFYGYNNLADYQWVGQFDGKQYHLSIKRDETIWFNGILTVNQSDTFKLRGFVKGNSYPSRFLIPQDSTYKNYFFMEYFGDSLFFDDESKVVLDTNIYFYKVKWVQFELNIQIG